MILTSERPLVLVGAGKMGGAMLSGWINDGFDPASLVVLDPNLSDEMAALVSEKGIRHFASASEASNLCAGILLVAIKPQMMTAVLEGLKPLADGGSVVLSVAAGTSIGSFRSVFGAGQPIVRAMPNTPAQVGRGVTAAFATPEVTSESRDVIARLLSAIGEFLWVENEEQIDFVTGVSGSGPAYVFHLAECMTEAGVRLGLPRDVAAKLARGTVCGAGELLYQSDLTPDVLRRNVTSPGGTTAAALNILMGDDALKNLMSDAVAAAAHRAKELSD